MRSSCTKFHYRSAGCRSYDSARLSSDKTLVIYQQKYHSFYELCLHNRTSYCNKRFMWEYDASFRHCPNIAFEFKVCQILKEFFIKKLLASQIFYIFFCEFQPLQILDDLFQTCEYSISATVRDLSEKHIEIRYVICHSGAVISVSHSDFIKVCEHRQVQFLNHF